MPPEVRSFVEDHHRGASPPESPPQRALDLGCGTGTNAVYLARHGWDVVGVDFAPRAVARARQRAALEHTTSANFIAADVTQLPDLGSPFDLALDIGCLHSLPARGRARYAAGLARVLRSGATYLLYAFLPAPGRPGITRDEVERLFADGFTLVRFEEGTGWPSAWYRFVRRDR